MRMGPFGRGFEAPLYSGTFRVATYRALTNGRHGRLRLERGKLTLEAIWFSIDSALERPPAVGDTIQVAYRLTRHEFRGQVEVQANDRRRRISVARISYKCARTCALTVTGEAGERVAR